MDNILSRTWYFLNKNLVKWIALITVVAFFATSLGFIGVSIFSGR